MSDATELIQDITEALKDAGAPVTITHVVVGTGPDDSGDTTLPVSTFGTLDASSLKGLGFQFGDGLVQVGDHKLKVPGGLGFVPAAGDKVNVLGANWRVVANQPTYYADTAVAFDLLVRG